MFSCFCQLIEHDAFAFGKLLKALVDQLTIEAVRGELPLLIKLPNDKNAYLKGNLMEVNKLTKTTKHAKRHFWLNDVCTCHGLLPSHSA
mgnify:CR=1 FL=1